MYQYQEKYLTYKNANLIKCITREGETVKIQLTHSNARALYVQLHIVFNQQIDDKIEQINNLTKVMFFVLAGQLSKFQAFQLNQRDEFIKQYSYFVDDMIQKYNNFVTSYPNNKLPRGISNKGTYINFINLLQYAVDTDIIYITANFT